VVRESWIRRRTVSVRVSITDTERPIQFVTYARRPLRPKATP
jgi:hypothetical protein